MLLYKTRLSSNLGFRLVKNPTLLLTLSKLSFKVALFAFILSLARNLSASDFSDFQFVSSIANMLAQPTYTLTMSIVYLGLSINAHIDRQRMAWLVKTCCVFSVYLVGMLFIGFSIINGPLTHIAHLHTRYAIIFGGTIIEAYIFFNVLNGLLLIKQRFFAMTVSYFIISVTTLIGAFLMMTYNMGQLFAYSVQTAALFIASLFIFTLISGRGLPKATKPVPLVKWASFKYFMNSTLILFAFFMMLNADIISVKILTPPGQAAFYLQQELISKLFFVIASSVGTIIFTKAMHQTTTEATAGHSQRSPINKFIPLILCTGILLIIFLTMISTFLIQHIFARNITTSTLLIATLLTGRLVQSCIYILISTQGTTLCRHHTSTMLICTLTEIALIIMLSHDIYDIAAIMTGSSIVCLILLWRTASRIRISTMKNKTVTAQLL